MGKRKVALGKGIASLIKETPQEILKKNLNDIEAAEKKVAAKAEITEGTPFMVDVNEIQPNPKQPRKIFKSQDLQELSLSIKENGILQPIVISKNLEGKGFYLIAGERRLRAAKMVGLERVPAFIKKVTDREQLILAILENVQRSDLNCVEVALGYFQLMNEFNLTQEEVAKKLGKERSSIANHLRILKLPKQVIDLVKNEELSFGHAKLLAGIKESEKAVRLATQAVDESMSVRELENLIKKSNVKPKTEAGNNRDERLESLKQNLENKTGFHFNLKRNNKGAGEIKIKFTNDAEFNDIYEYLTRR
ncbi:MAG: ParB/RepB/Spo0J family partition protein [Bacteriovoracaceae bacterium]